MSLAIAATTFADAGKPYASPTKDGQGAVASVHPVATQIGLDVFERGGNAIDAALATAFALGVVDGFNSGIGGGCFIVAHLANGEIVTIDGREMAPAAASRDMFLRNGKADPDLSRTGALAVGIPGSVAALHALQEQGGLLSFSDVILPSANIAEDGFEINDLYAKRLSRASKKLLQFDASTQIFLKDGQPYEAGETLIQKDLAKTYRQLAKKGPSYFYDGKFSKKTARWMKKNGGLITKKDFERYQIKYREPVKSLFKGYEIVGFPPPSSGGIHVSQILSMMSMYSPSKEHTDADLYHWYIESSKRAFADRAHWLGDADFAAVPLGLLDGAYLEKRANSIDGRASKGLEHGLPPNYKDALFNRHTTHLSAADKEGNWVAITTTLNTTFGSGVTIPGTGVMLNNQMDDFSAQPGMPNAFGLVGAEANAVAPFKRPLSSMSPTLVLKDGKPIMAVGAAGGPTIISQVAQTLINTLMLNMPLKQAMERARVHHQWQPNMVFVDGYTSEEIKSDLEKRGHALKVWPKFGATQAIMLEDGLLNAQSEPRIQ